MARYYWESLPRRVQEYVQLDRPTLVGDPGLRWFTLDDEGISWLASDEADNAVYVCRVPRFVAKLTKVDSLPVSLRNLTDIEADQYRNAIWVQVEADRWVAVDRYSVLGDFRIPQGKDGRG